MLFLLFCGVVVPFALFAGLIVWERDQRIRDERLLRMIRQELEDARDWKNPPVR